MIDNERFKLLCEEQKAVNKVTVFKKDIGLLNEKILHAVLKLYYEPNLKYHEIKVGSFYADISKDNYIIEIQTRQLDKLRNKLSLFLQDNIVTVIHPITRKKTISWIEKHHGVVDEKPDKVKSRKSTRVGTLYDVLPELYKIKHFLNHPNFRMCVVLLDVEEYRFLDGFGESRKRGSSRSNRVPTDIIEEIFFKSPSDYLAFLPNAIPEEFTSKELVRLLKQKLSTCQLLLNILSFLNVIKTIGKIGNLKVYSLNKES